MIKNIVKKQETGPVLLVAATRRPWFRLGRESEVLGGSVKAIGHQGTRVLSPLVASFPSNALTGQPLVVSHGWHMR
jgi:hypothetical protein